MAVETKRENLKPCWVGDGREIRNTIAENMLVAMSFASPSLTIPISPTLETCTLTATCYPLCGNYFTNKYQAASMGTSLSFFSSHSITKDIGTDHLMH